jgi:hypothetical protein
MDEDRIRSRKLAAVFAIFNVKCDHRRWWRRL